MDLEVNVGTTLIDVMNTELEKIKEELMIAQENSFAEMKKDLLKIQKETIQTEIAKATKLFQGTNCVEVENCVSDNFGALHTVIDRVADTPR